MLTTTGETWAATARFAAAVSGVETGAAGATADEGTATGGALVAGDADGARSPESTRVTWSRGTAPAPASPTTATGMDGRAETVAVAGCPATSLRTDGAPETDADAEVPGAEAGATVPADVVATATAATTSPTGAEGATDAVDSSGVSIRLLGDGSEAAGADAVVGADAAVGVVATMSGSTDVSAAVDVDSPSLLLSGAAPSADGGIAARMPGTSCAASWSMAVVAASTSTGVPNSPAGASRGSLPLSPARSDEDDEAFSASSSICPAAISASPKRAPEPPSVRAESASVCAPSITPIRLTAVIRSSR